jgi:hypothetical protein
MRENYIKASRRLTGLNILHLMFKKFCGFITKKDHSYPEKTQEFLQKTI